MKIPIISEWWRKKTHRSIRPKLEIYFPETGTRLGYVKLDGHKITGVKSVTFCAEVERVPTITMQIYPGTTDITVEFVKLDLRTSH